MAEGEPIVEGPALVSDPKDREDQSKNKPSGITRRQFLLGGAIAVIGAALAEGARRRGISLESVAGEPTQAEKEAEEVELREAEWAYLLNTTEPGEPGQLIPETFAKKGRDKGVDINQKETWVDNRVALYFKSLGFFTTRLLTPEGRADLAQIITYVGAREGSEEMKSWVDGLNDNFAPDEKYENETQLFEKFFGKRLGFSQMELAIYKGALDLWRTDNATIEFEGRVTTFKDLVNRYNQENKIDVKPLP
jgi:hypothetical protein